MNKLRLTAAVILTSGAALGSSASVEAQEKIIEKVPGNCDVWTPWQDIEKSLKDPDYSFTAKVLEPHQGTGHIAVESPLYTIVGPVAVECNDGKVVGWLGRLSNNLSGYVSAKYTEYNKNSISPTIYSEFLTGDTQRRSYDHTLLGRLVSKELHAETDPCSFEWSFPVDQTKVIRFGAYYCHPAGFEDAEGNLYGVMP